MYKNYVVRSDADEEAELIQRHAFGVGFAWKGGETTPILLGETFFVFRGEDMTIFAVDEDEAQELSREHGFRVVTPLEFVDYLKTDISAIEETEEDPWIPSREQLVKYFMAHRLRP